MSEGNGNGLKEALAELRQFRYAQPIAVEYVRAATEAVALDDFRRILARLVVIATEGESDRDAIAAARVLLDRFLPAKESLAELQAAKMLEVAAADGIAVPVMRR